MHTHTTKGYIVTIRFIYKSRNKCPGGQQAVCGQQRGPLDSERASPAKLQAEFWFRMDICLLLNLLILCHFGTTQSKCVHLVCMLQPPFRTVKALRRREGIAILCSLLEAASAPLPGQLNTPLDSGRKEKEREGRLQGKRRKKERKRWRGEGRKEQNRKE